ncbi:MAG: hypothetical protein ABJC55_14365 [Algoriphagus sp.]
MGLGSCSSGLEKKLLGTWQGSDFLFVKTAGPDLVATVNGGLDQHVKSRLILNEDSTYQRLVGEYDNGQGTWKVNDDQLILRDEAGNELIYKVMKVTEMELVISQEVSMDTPSGELSGSITLSYLR